MPQLCLIPQMIKGIQKTRFTDLPMKKHSTSKSRRGPNIWPPKVGLRDVEEIDTKRCLQMTMRLLRPKALPEVPIVPWGPFLN